MLRILSAYFFGLVDLVRALWHIVTFQHRNTYRTSVIIDAPIEKVWDLLIRPDVTFESVSLRTVIRPAPGEADAMLADLEIGGAARGAVAFRYLEQIPQQRLSVLYLPELSTARISLGADDRLSYALATRPDGRTTLDIERSLTHTRMATRIAVPIGLRAGGFMTRQQAELEAGTRKPVNQTQQQLLWAPLAFASFAWMFGWVDALILMVLIAIHEIGHALAMLSFGLGVSVISFIPFFGGVAAPKRHYQTQWQHAVVLLMGVGFSLPFAAALLWGAYATANPLVAKAASLFAVINGINLLPVPMLDGGGVATMLLSRLHKRLAQGVGILMLTALAALAAWIGDPILWILVALGAVSFVQVAALKIDEHLPRLSNGHALLVTFLYLGLIAAYVALSLKAIAFEVTLEP